MYDMIDRYRLQIFNTGGGHTSVGSMHRTFLLILHTSFIIIY